MIEENTLQKIGVFAKPHGIKGEITLITDYDISCIAGDPFIVCDIDGILTPFFIDSYRPKGVSTTLVTFDNFDSEDKVKLLTGKTALVVSQQFLSTEVHTFSLEKLVGYAIIDEQIGTLGKVLYIDDSTPNILLAIEYKGDEIFVPLSIAKSLRHDQEAIYLSLPKGFLEI